jgi:CRP/FNR family cyclic AMP-dependent transcriptional regulator
MARMIRALDAVPELAGDLAGEELAAATGGALAVGQPLDRGPWDPDGLLANTMGGVVRDGLIVRRSTFGGAPVTALAGPGDVVLASSAATQLASSWEVLQPTTILWLGPTYQRATHRWPALSRALIALAHEGTERALALQAVAQLQRVDDRLLALLGHFADRWGRVTAHGVVLPLRLPHRLLADLVGARRPSVTTALSGLAAAGRVLRHAEGGWLLRGLDLDWEACPATVASCASPVATRNATTLVADASPAAPSPVPAAMPPSFWD